MSQSRTVEILRALRAERGVSRVYGNGREIAYGDLQKVTCPQPTKSRPRPSLPHVDVFDKFKHIIELQDHVKIVKPIFLVSPKTKAVPNAKFMARFEIQKVVPGGGGITDHYGVSPDYSFQGAITNSYDNSLDTCCYFGTQVFVCTNGAWLIKTKMNSSRVLANNTMEEFGTMVWNISCELDDIYNDVAGGFEALRELDFSSQREVHDFVSQSVRRGVLHMQEPSMVLRHWNEPEHAEFRDRNGYSLFNAYTSHWRDSDQFVLPDKTMRLRKFMAEFKKTIRINNTLQRS